MRWTMGLWGLLWCLLGGLVTEANAAEAETLEQPRILSISLDGDDLLVEVDVPEGFQRITLESRTRLERGSWVPRRVQHLDGEGGTFTFRLKREAALEVLRVSGTDEELLPANFYEGSKFFAGPSSQPDTGGAGGVPPAPTLDSAVRDPSPPASPELAGGDAAAPDREVVESDIWQVSGNRMFFFNQFRGLQVIDITNPDEPSIIGTLELPAAGEQMYVLDESYVALLARDTCNYFGGGAESRVVIVDVSETTPVVAASIPVAGNILESRLVGTALYLASQTYHRFQAIDERTGEPGDRWEWGTIVSSYDLALPNAPVAREEHWVPGSGHVIHATSEYLFVSTQGVGSRWWQSRIQMIDISSPDGTLVPMSEIRPAGRVIDKFKMNVNGDVLTVISEINTRSRVTRLETYDISNPMEPTRLGSVDVGQNESLHATRFDGNKAYIVTFFRIDPLWVVDLSDPANPTISGELEVPGWSTYIQPLGDRLLSIGIDDVDGFRVAVSLFDVRDPANPGLLDRVPLGTNNSWSEANRDEKALGFVPEAGLVMIPFNSYDTEDNRTGVQLVELDGDDLILRGTIEHDVTPRRATLYESRILSLSGKSLLTVDAADYDAPAVVNELPLSWAVDRVYAEGEFLIEVTQGNPWSDEAPALRVAAQDAPYEILAQAELPEPNIVASTVRDGRLYIVQTEQGQNRFGPFPELADDAAEGAEAEAEQPHNLRVSVYDTSQLPNLSLLGTQSWHAEGVEGAANVGLHFPYDDVMTISMWQHNYFYGGPIGIAIDVAIAPPFWGGTQGRRFVSVSVGAPESMQILSNYEMETGNTWSLSEVFASGTKLYMSHQSSQFIGEDGERIEETDPEEEDAKPLPPGAPADLTILPEPRPFPGGRWLQQYFLDVLDLADPENPTERRPVNIPGHLVGLGRGGDLLYTKAPHWDEETFETDWLEWLDASAYDGVTATLVDSLPLTFRWPHPTLVENDVVYVGTPATNGHLREGEQRQPDNRLSAYALADSGDFQLLSATVLPFPAQELRVSDDLLLARVNQDLWFYDVGQAGELNPLGSGSQSNCFGFNLTAADGSAEGGLWVPGGDYGVSHIPLLEDLDRVVAVHGGTTFGFCLGFCETQLEVGPGRVVFKAFERTGDPERFGRDFYSSQGLSADEWDSLLASVDLAAVRALPSTIGCPDCADGGAEWFQIFTPGGVVRVNFPFGDEVAGAEDLVKQLRGLRDRFELPELKPIVDPEEEPERDPDEEGEDEGDDPVVLPPLPPVADEEPGLLIPLPTP